MIHTEIRGQAAFATLNRATALNALNLQMVEDLLQKIRFWERAPEVRVIVLKGAGAKSFCSGGDVRAVCLELENGNEAYARDFFAMEYRLDHAIHRCKKPVVVVGHGYVLGGGVGLLAGAAFRIVTSSTSLAMPEISIGLFPDVGGSWFLSRLPGKLGLFLALTGARLNAADLLKTGLADVYVPDADLPEFYEAVASQDWDKRKLGDFLREFAARFHAPDAQGNCAEEQLFEINEALSADDPRLAFADLAALGARTKNAWLKHSYGTFALGSPTSAFLIFEELRRGRGLTLEDAFRMELDLAIQTCRHHDFQEGVRALLIDKKGSPHWQPARLEEVTKELVCAHFESPWPNPRQSPLADL